MTARKTALIVGASRGLGLALAEEFCTRGWEVIATSRGKASGLDELRARHPGKLEHEHVDIDDLDTVRALHARLDKRKLDVLFVNAGIAKANELTPIDVDEADFLDMMRTNALAPMRVVELFHDQVDAGKGVIAVMSSEIGSIGNANGFWELYSSSKAALNMLLASFHARHPGDRRAVLAVAPGWVRTDMGTQDATLDISDSIPLVVDVVEANAGKPGLRFVDRHGAVLPW
ncbi:SDR family NAD(P)-dependent oxidoreductase [Luteibacter aegosomatis]|uniref:SDR family NAD(P)-dependent oxidoreductase n=1 Tax=Luteibacter aegosomatis TaxID=2911537 RepID=UPI001FF8DC70|nr:SDR family NAD(P)-dependent oxidoreductase [Luteibacter aegosomatis]UPG84689.1 SDR family NAD(P)-dependent oxidoreductase [Luteibacter aegosomatis]